MYTKKENVYKKLDELNIKYKKVDHKAVFTMEEMAELNLENEDEIVKNIFIRDDKKINYYLVLIAGNKRVNLKELRNNLRLRPLTFASEEDLEKYLGLHKGSVTVLGVLNDTNHIVKVLIDEDIKKFKEIGVHPNENTASIWLKLEDIEKVLVYTIYILDGYIKKLLNGSLSNRCNRWYDISISRSNCRILYNITNL